MICRVFARAVRDRIEIPTSLVDRMFAAPWNETRPLVHAGEEPPLSWWCAWERVLFICLELLADGAS